MLPNVPTVAEAVPGFVINGWYGILAPANTPPAILDTLSSAIAAAINTPDLKAQLNSYGYETVGSSPPPSPTTSTRNSTPGNSSSKSPARS